MLATKPALDLSRIGASVDLRSTGLAAKFLDRLGASDAAPVAGVDDYGSLFAVWARLAMGIEEPVPSWVEEAAYFGEAIEPIIVNAWATQRGADLGRVVKPPTRVSSVREWQRVSLDGFAYADVPGGAEITETKLISPRRFDSETWGAEGSSDVPMRLVAQVTCQLEAMRAEREWWLGEYCIDPAEIDRVHVAVLVGGQALKSYVVPYDAALGGMLVERFERLWFDYVVPKAVPPVDFGGATVRALARLYPKATQPLRPATEEEAELAKRHAYIRAMIKDLEADKKIVEAQLAQAIAEAQGLTVGDEGNVKWNSRKGSPSWRPIAEALAVRAGVAGRELAELVAANTGAGTRYITNSLAVDAAEED